MYEGYTLLIIRLVIWVTHPELPGNDILGVLNYYGPNTVHGKPELGKPYFNILFRLNFLVMI